MSAHSPRLPLIIDYDDQVCDVTVEDENDIALVLEQRDRVHRIRIPMSVPNRIHHLLVGELSHSLRPDDGELPLELLHKLQELVATSVMHSSTPARMQRPPCNPDSQPKYFRVAILFYPCDHIGEQRGRE
jgi:hypothetical protein